MKKLILISIAWLLMANASGQNLIHNSIGFRYTPYIKDVCAYLNIEDSEIIIRSINNERIAGVAAKVRYHCYVIYVNINTEHNIYEILGHGLTHIKQHQEGEWDLDRGTTKISHYSIRYVNEKARKIEVEARKNGNLLSEKFKHSKRR